MLKWQSSAWVFNWGRISHRVFLAADWRQREFAPCYHDQLVTVALMQAAAASSNGFFLMAGPNVIQSEEHCLKMCGYIKSVCDELGITYIFKSSFDKANRTSAASFRGPGMEEGLRVLQKVKDTYNVPIVTDIHEAYQAEPVGK
eukprot:scaffold278459_cov46-Prasinocladus_malaysianus.AAC.4